MPENTVISIREYLGSINNSAIVFVLRDYNGKTLDSQIVRSENIKIKSSRTISAEFKVDQVLTQKMVPGNYRLFTYIGIPKEGVETPTKVKDYILDKCLTEQGIRIRVDGELDGPSVGVN